MIDLHCHALPEIDDGPATMDEAVALARAQVAAGVRTVVATPHVSYHHATVDAALIARRAEELRAALAEAGIELELLTGAEVALARAGELDDDELSALRLGGSRWLLTEAPMSPAGATGVEAALLRLAGRGHRILLAHPERCPVFQRDRGLLERLVAGGMRCSITASAVTGHFGNVPRRFALELLRDGLVHDVSSDAHELDRRPPGIAGPLEEAGWGAHIRWLCDEAPRAMLDGRALPPPPPAPADGRRRGLSRLLRRA